MTRGKRSLRREHQLFKAYEETLFWVELPGSRLCIRVNEASTNLDKFLDAMSVGEWAFVTAFNPGSIQALNERVMGFQSHYEKTAKPFEWKFTRRDLNELIQKMRLAA